MFLFFTITQQEFCSLPQLENRKDALIDMLNNFIKHFRYFWYCFHAWGILSSKLRSQRLSPLRYSQMVVKIASLSAEPLPIVQQALDAVEHFSHSEEAQVRDSCCSLITCFTCFYVPLQILLRCTVARYVLLVESDQKKCRDLLEAQEPKLKGEEATFNRLLVLNHSIISTATTRPISLCNILRILRWVSQGTWIVQLVYCLPIRLVDSCYIIVVSLTTFWA